MASSDTPDPASYLTPYRRAVESFGPSFEATLWASREKQIERFRVMCEMFDFTGRTILDAGSGLGDLALYLVEQGTRFGRYIGIEGVEEIVAKAQTLGLPEAEFHAGDFVSDERIFTRHTDRHGLDVVVFSGSLNTLQADDARRVLERAWVAADEALIFNFLSARHGNPDAIDSGPAVRFDPLAMLDWALAITPRVRFRQEYFDGHDATVAMFKRERPHRA